MKSRPSIKTPLSCSRLARVIVLSEARRASLAPARPPATIGASGAFPTRLLVSRRIAGSRLPGLSRQVQSTAGGRRLLGSPPPENRASTAPSAASARAIRARRSSRFTRRPATTISAATRVSSASMERIRLPGTETSATRPRRPSEEGGFPA